MNNRIYYVDFGEEQRTLTHISLLRAVKNGEIDQEQGVTYRDPSTQEEDVGCQVKDVLDD